jgi:methionyl-tRNA formyltransferase
VLVFASNLVGLRALEVLINKKAQIGCLVLHRTDPGKFNDQLRGLHATHLSTMGTRLIFNDSLGTHAFEAMRSGPHDIGVLAWWPEIIRDPLLSLPRRGWVNFHPSYLPFNRGKYPNFWCLADGTPCGVALHFATNEVDGGQIIARAIVPVTWEDTGETVYRKSLTMIVDLFREQIDNILSGKIELLSQAGLQGSFHNASEIDPASCIDLDRNYRARDLLNVIRARTFPPHPSAHFFDQGRKYTVEITIKEIEKKDG